MGLFPGTDAPGHSALSKRHYGSLPTTNWGSVQAAFRELKKPTPGVSFGKLN
jgi:hypothetical protein